mmetsp:Transcript_11822/g.38940  ORF Transcript_11822/g.38940 Transcript_11822/m.38940 type:complete len:234 (-) Transcript_11822:201-902(-)|eukprot:CAMPEP_0118910462 /NCGR_PEP_ID=MMETSP1166-20130328/12589_1 /TAXON_ID=1104430 /ORGANISM="Chrysoreinhardia sp, Strain CCMP3193" /LENGTH=233 /DNA_ID=CAMNT_0006849929 /DNA_START=180 /DNA_END=881 /DNA_ORIENTATION=-
MSALSRRRHVAVASQKSRREDLLDSRRGIDRHSILDRVGEREALTRIVAKNITASVSAEEVRSLFSTAGAVTRIASVLTGATAVYEIDFADPDAARRALYEYDRRTLDGREMTLALARGGEAAVRANKTRDDKKKATSAGAALFAAAVNDANRTAKVHGHESQNGNNKGDRAGALARAKNGKTKDKPTTTKNIVVDVTSVLKSSATTSQRKATKKKNATPIRLPPKFSKSRRN